MDNYPNPYNTRKSSFTTINLSVKEVDKQANFSIYNSKGQLIESQEFSPGKYTYKWNAKNYSSGIYFYKLETDSYSEIKKMMVIR